MTRTTDLRSGWLFREGFDRVWTQQPPEGAPVVLPHNAVDMPIDYFDERAYQRPFTYQRSVPWEPRFEGKEVLLRFEGAMADAHVYLNGTLAAHHPDGYTPFEVRLTDHFQEGAVQVTVHLDGSENPDIPPFGGRIDYLTYAGLYREASLKVVDPVSIAALKIEPQDVLSPTKSLLVKCWASAPDDSQDFQWTLRLKDASGAVIASATATADTKETEIRLENLEGIALWQPGDPVLYHVEATLSCGDNEDRVTERFGWRTAEFTPTGFRLNGAPLKLIGLNRHQSYPYAGYAFGRDAQARDAEIVKHELGCNIVRTSHYPQSKAFLERCDEIGLLVLEEIPGWQYLGGPLWQDRAVDNVRAMIERDWNHPSIILWGVRINESVDDDAFYTRTNALTHQLDTTRQTGGIRKHVLSTLLEDVYTFNDFILGEHLRPGTNTDRQALRDPQTVTGLPEDVPYMVTEYNGHMFPTKVTDGELRQVEHVKRHLDVLNATFGVDRISGCIGWCMFDYNTHADFGSGDRICHHGVMTMFREPKFAAAAYASQRPYADGVVFEPVTYWARGERNIGGVFPLTVLTNVEEVRLRIPGQDALSFFPDRKDYPHLPNPPVVIGKDAFGEEILGKWGGEWPSVELEGLVGGEVVTRRAFARDPVATELAVIPDADSFAADHQELRIVVRALDQEGNKLHLIDASVEITVKGPATVIGPARRTLRGGATGCWIRSNGTPGEIAVTVRSDRFPESTVHITSAAPSNSVGSEPMGLGA
ncbi:MAG: glycoside hydrolase family 2 TIM barrel-domain containing protein [Pseudomonadota bacterium]